MSERMDTHHALWERNSYKTPSERRLRNLGALSIKAPIIWHRDLHANMQPPPKPEPELMHNMYQFLQERDYESGTLEGLEWAMTYLVQAKEYELFEHFDEQFFWLSKGLEHLNE